MIGKNVCVVFGLNLCLSLKISNAQFLCWKNVFHTEDLHHKEDFASVQDGLSLTNAKLRANSVIIFNQINLIRLNSILFFSDGTVMQVASRFSTCLPMFLLDPIHKN